MRDGFYVTHFAWRILRDGFYVIGSRRAKARPYILSLRENHEVLATERKPEGQAQRSKLL